MIACCDESTESGGADCGLGSGDVGDVDVADNTVDDDGHGLCEEEDCDDDKEEEEE